MRVRLLPVLMFALVGTITVKVGTLWNAFEVSVGTESLAQNQPAAPANPTPAPAAQPTAVQPAAVQPAAVQPATAAPAQNASTEQPAPAAPATTGQPAPGAEAGPTAPVGTSTVSADPGIDEAPVPDPFSYTDEEVDVLQQLAKRREELDLRARQLDERDALIQAAEQRMDQKMAELKALQATVEDLLRKRSDAEEAELKSLVKMYENMKPKDAAQVFEEMDMDVLLDVVERMSERKAAPIIALITPTRAKEVTFELAQRRSLPTPQ